MEALARYRQLRGPLRPISIAIACGVLAVALYHILGAHAYVEGLPFFMIQQSGALVMGLLLALTFLYLPPTSKAPRDRVPWYDLLLAALSLPGPGWLFVNYMQVIKESLDVFPPLYLLLLGSLTILIILEALRRTVGLFFTAIVLFFVSYPVLSRWMPGVFFAKGWDFDRTLGFLFLSDEGIIGLPLSVLMNVLLAFILFTAMLKVSGGGKFIMDIALAVAGWLRGGPAKVAIVSSALFGSMSGSALANVAGTGTITIPLMKRIGYKPYYAAAVEAVASTGGQIMPPVMGTTAFVMADFLQVSYAYVVLVAFIPAILYYLGVFLQTDFQAAKMGMKGLPRHELPSAVQSLKEGWVFLLGLVVLVWLLLVWHWGPGKAALYASAAMAALAMVRRETRLNAAKLLELVESTARMLTEVIAVLAGAGIIIGSVMLTGLGANFTRLLAGQAGENMILLLLLAGVACFILGMGVPVVGVYILVAMFVAPAFVTLGIPAIAVHLALLYWAVLSFITPPVALAAYLAAAIAGADPIRTGIQATLLGIVAFFIPILIILQPALVLQGSSATTIVLAVGFSVVAVALLASGVEGYMLGRTGTAVRLLFLAAAFMVMAGLYAGWTLSLAGLALGVAATLWQWTRRPRWN